MEGFKNNKKVSKKEILKCLQESPPKGKGSLEQRLKLPVEFPNKPAHGLASVPKYKGQSRPEHGRLGREETFASHMWLCRKQES